MNDNKKFWNRFAFIYEKVQTTGKDAKKFYQELGAEIGKQLHSDMKVLELAMGPIIQSLCGRISRKALWYAKRKHK